MSDGPVKVWVYEKDLRAENARLRAALDDALESLDQIAEAVNLAWNTIVETIGEIEEAETNNEED